MAITIESLMESMREMIVKNAVEACAAMYGFSSVEALTRLDKSGNVVVVKEVEEIKIQKKKVKVSKEAILEIKRDQESKTAEKKAIKDAELEEKKELKESIQAEKKALKEVELAEKKALKEVIKAEKNVKKAQKKQKKNVEESISSTVIMSSDEEEIVINLANVDLIKEIKKIRDIAYPYRLSNGVKLARQILDI
jgi:hypothetical protein